VAIFGAKFASSGIITGLDLVTSITSNVDLWDNVLDISSLPQSGSGYVRLYVVLETSPMRAQRKLRIDGIKPVAGLAGAGEALLVGDDINYNTNGPFVDALDIHGKKNLCAPWSPGCANTFAGPLERAGRSEGWYLVGKNTKDARGDKGFFSLVYYNERISRLRVYLFNSSLSQDVTAYTIRVSLWGKTSVGYKELRGAFFDLDARPARWSSAEMVLPVWPINTWTRVEIPMLYPMAESLYGIQDIEGERPCSFRAVYEERMGESLRNVRLRIELTGYIKLSVEGDIDGKAVGTAIQQEDILEFLTVVKGGFKAFKEGRDWYNTGEWSYKKIVKLGGGAIAASGVGYVSAAFAAVGAAVTFFDELFGDDQLQLAVELALRAKLDGTVFGPLLQTKRYHDFYMPGRVSVQEAFFEGQAWDAAGIETAFPRYDRTMGHLGYCFDPSTLEIRVLRIDTVQEENTSRFMTTTHQFMEPDTVPLWPDDVHWLAYFVFPASSGIIYDDEYFSFVVPGRRALHDVSFHEFFDDEGDLIATPEDLPPKGIAQGLKMIEPLGHFFSLNAAPVIDQMLPVIYNPYAELVMAAPTPVGDGPVETWVYPDSAELAPDIPPEERKSTVHAVEGPLWTYEPWYAYVQDMSWARHVTPEAADATFPKDEKAWKATTEGPQSYLQVFNGNGGFSLARGGYAGNRARAQIKYGIGTEETYPRIGPLPHGIRINVKPLPQYVPGTYHDFEDTKAYTDEGQMYWAIFYKQEPGAESTREWFPDIGIGLPRIRYFNEHYEKPVLPLTAASLEAPWSYTNLFDTIRPLDPDHKLDETLSVFARKYPYERSPEGPGFRPFEKDDPFPLRDVIFHRDVVYFYYGRSKALNYAVPGHRERRHLQAPITINLSRVLVDPRYDEHLGGKSRVWYMAPSDLKLKSRLLVEPPFQAAPVGAQPGP
jgi:hypothetical protein